MSKFSKQHYEMIAAALGFEVSLAASPEAQKTIVNVCENFGRMLAADNPNFDEKRFIEAIRKAAASPVDLTARFANTVNA